jgi:hypothetical protein
MRPRLSLRRSRIVVFGAALVLTGVAFLGCDPTPPIDVNFDSSLGADFKAPPEDAGQQTAPDAGDTSAP